MIKLNLAVQSLLGNDNSPHPHSGEQNTYYQLCLLQTLYAGLALMRRFNSHLGQEFFYRICWPEISLRLPNRFDKNCQLQLHLMRCHRGDLCPLLILGFPQFPGNYLLKTDQNWLLSSKDWWYPKGLPYMLQLLYIHSLRAR